MSNTQLMVFKSIFVTANGAIPICLVKNILAMQRMGKHSQTSSTNQYKMSLKLRFDSQNRGLGLVYFEFSHMSFESLHSSFSAIAFDLFFVLSLFGIFVQFSFYHLKLICTWFDG